MNKVWYLLPERDAGGAATAENLGERDARAMSRLLVLPPASIRLARRIRRTKKSPV